jgi:hypothetical protein
MRATAGREATVMLQTDFEERNLNVSTMESATERQKLDQVRQRSHRVAAKTREQ